MAGILTHPGHKSASQRIPVLVEPFVSDRAKKTLDLLEEFVETRCIPADHVFEQQLGQGVEQRFGVHPQVLEQLKAEAQRLGFWNMFLSKAHYGGQGAGYSNLEFGLMAELMGRSFIASEATNNAAPDTGNMEVLAKYGSPEQKARWLRPLLEGRIRSSFLMTEPQVASSDARNIEMSIVRDGNEYVLNGQKWWSSGSGYVRCEIYIVMGKTDPGNPAIHKQQSMVLVPANTPGVTIKRMLSVLGYDHAPHGHGHIVFENVRVPVSNMILGEGRGFEIAQGRLGPGRIHHAMRSIGNAERALEYLIARLNDPAKKPFGKRLADSEIMLERVARSRVEIDAARLAVLNAAATIDKLDAKGARKEIAEIKILTPTMLQTVADRAMQAYGAAGVCQDTPLPELWVAGRVMRIVDGPDEVHLLQLGRDETKKGTWFLDKIRAQLDAAVKLSGSDYLRDPLELNREGTSKVHL